MASVKTQDTLDHLRTQVRHALRDAAREVAPNVVVNEQALYGAFKRAVGRKCPTWKNVPDSLVDGDD
jgi:hypothetical protein